MIGEQRRLGGRLVTTDGSSGVGPPVILLAGCGVPHTLWEAVRAGLLGRRVVWLDRPGMGGTPWPGRVPTLSEEVATLAELAVREDAPVIWVAHSIAGPHAEAVTRQYPRLVGGLVLVDSSVEWRPPVGAGRRGGWNRFAGATRWFYRRRPVGALAHALLRGQLGSPTARRFGISSSMAAELTEILPQPDTQAMTVAEFGGCTGQITELYAIRARHPWPTVPTEVLTALKGSGRRWLDAQARLAGLLGATHHRIDAGHNMMLDRPEAVVASIERVANQIG